MYLPNIQCVGDVTECANVYECCVEIKILEIGRQIPFAWEGKSVRRRNLNILQLMLLGVRSFLSF